MLADEESASPLLLDPPGYTQLKTSYLTIKESYWHVLVNVCFHFTSSRILDTQIILILPILSNVKFSTSLLFTITNHVQVQ